jgi:hypothetical protein
MPDPKRGIASGTARRLLGLFADARFILVLMPIVDHLDRESRRNYATEAVSYYLKLNNMPGRLNFEVVWSPPRKRLCPVVPSLDWLSKLKFDFHTRQLSGASVYVFGRQQQAHSQPASRKISLASGKEYGLLCSQEMKVTF